MFRRAIFNLKSDIYDSDVRKNLAINKLRPMTRSKPPCFRIFPHLSAYFRIPAWGAGVAGPLEWVFGLIRDISR